MYRDALARAGKETVKTPLRFTDEVRDALRARAPVVALESTIVTHGMPHPENLETARAVEAAVRAEGALPATIAVLEGEVTVGLDEAALEGLARSEGAMKLSRADLGIAVARGVTGSTTVAATMIVAKLAGIELFATGGIGGVHRGAEHSFDVSADLHELGRTAVTVVAAGAKAILDLPKTLELLESLGVPVIAYGQDVLPAFWSRDGGLAAPLRMDTPAELVAFLLARERLSLDGGVLVANPVPAEHEIPGDEIDGYVERAVGEAEARGVRGKDVTPWLLARIVELSDGRTLASNRALIVANASLAARLAVALGEARGDDAYRNRSPL